MKTKSIRVRSLLTIIVMLVLALACSDNKKTSVGAADSTEVKEESKLLIQKSFDSNLLEGVWWTDVNAPSALFFIQHDSLYYTEELNKPYYVSIQNDTLKFIRNDLSSHFKLRLLTKDSMVFYDFIGARDIKLINRGKITD